MSVLFNRVARGIFYMSLVLALASCAGEKSDLEEARYSMGKGEAQKASDLVTPILESGDVASKLEAYQIYAGSQIMLAGFDSSKVVGALIFPGESTSGEKETVKLINTIATLTSTSASVLSAASTKMGTFIASSDYTSSSNTRGKNGVEFELGLVQFFKALQSAIQDTGFSSATFSLSDCESKITTAVVDAISSNLTSARIHFINTGLDATNDLVKLLDSLNEKATGVSALCSYINGQRPAQ